MFCPCHIPLGPRAGAPLLAVLLATTLAAEEKKEDPKTESPAPIRALLVTGGASHDYPTRERILTRGIAERIRRPVEWTVQRQGEGAGDLRIPLFESADWAEGHELVVHDYCFPRVHDPAYLERILAPHRAGLPAVLVHGSLISFLGSEAWTEFTGATIRTHEPEGRLRVEASGKSEAWLPGLPRDFAGEELYRVERQNPGLEIRATAHDGAGGGYPVVWTRRYGPGGARVFATTLGNSTATLREAAFLDMVARGFHWALGEDEEVGMVGVPAEKSLAGLELPPAAEFLPRPGWHELLGAPASAFAWGSGEDDEGASRVVDGHPGTVWRARGPGSWRVELPRPRSLSAIVVLWAGPRPRRALLEISSDGQSWRAVEAAIPPAAEGATGARDRAAGGKIPGESGEGSPEFYPFEAGVVSQVRLSVAQPAPGGFALAEVAAYPGVGEIPAALALAAGAFPAGWAGGGPRKSFPGDGPSPDWRVAASGRLTLPGRVRQVVPTAEGGVFLSLFGEGTDEVRGRVVRVEADGEGGIRETRFLDEIEPDSLIAWDGEWLFILQRGDLAQVRRALGRGPADERRRLGRVFSAESAGGPVPLAGLHLGDDGWLHLRAEGGEGARIFDPSGRTVDLPEAGRLRIRRDGRRWQVSEDWADPPLPDLGGREQGALVVADGTRVWMAREEEGSVEVSCLVPRGEPFESGPDWNGLSTAELFDFLGEAQRTTVRREAAAEILRRRRVPFGEVERRLAEAPAPAVAEALVSVVAGLDEGRSLDWLERLAATAPVSVRVPAFLALGDHPAATNHNLFAQLASTPEPELFEAICEAIRRSSSDPPGAEEMARRLFLHPNRNVASRARAFFENEDALAAAGAILADESRRDDREASLAVLVEEPSAAAVDLLVREIENTPDPGWRHRLRQALCDLAYTGPERSRWEQTDRIERILHESLGDSRTDRIALLRAMEEAGVPSPGGEALVRLAREDLSLEPYALAILEEATDLSPAAREWLKVVARDPHRDEALRRRAATLLDPSLVTGSAPEPPVAPPFAKAPGREVFRGLSCHLCHNVDGEGPRAAPDLVTLAVRHDNGEILAALRDPRPLLVEASTTWLEDGQGRRLPGVLEPRGDSVPVLRDGAGNRFEAEAGKWRVVGDGPVPVWPCARLTAPLDEGAHGRMLDYLRSLAPPEKGPQP